MAEVRVLGPVEIIGDTGPVAFTPKQRRLLAALALADGRVCSADWLADILWGAAPPPSARKLLQVYVSQLRKVLPDGLAVVTRSAGYALVYDGASFDAGRFARLLEEAAAALDAGNPKLAASVAAQALALWRGAAYADVMYDEFARGEAERLEEQRLVASELRLDAQLRLGRHDDVLGEILALADAHPLRERVQELAMLALYRAGRQVDALDRFERVRRRLDDELGLEPGPALRELQRRILRQDAMLDAPDGALDAYGALPQPPNPLVGRGQELDRLDRLLSNHEVRLLVLTGAGGSGKTRLALEAARRAAASFANGVALVELAPLRDAELVLTTIAQTLGLTADSEAGPLEALAAALAPQELLLVVDNAEHVREAAPSFAQLVARAPRLTVLVTSRTVLHVSGEHVFPVAPLPEEDAVELFAQRARLLESSFSLTAENESDVREVCRRVDCLPLGVELAAARVRTLTPRALRQRLERRLSLLTGGPRDLPARQQTLRETIAWSVGLLAEHEVDVFARLAVFPAGTTMEAAEEICGADLDVLGALVDHHLVLRADVGGEPRFSMLETVREYALELLGGERPDVERALADYFVRFADELRLGTTEQELRRIVDGLDPEIENVRAALSAAAASADSELQLRLAGGFSRYWQYRGPVAEGLEWIERAIASSDGRATAARAHALRTGAGLAWMRGNATRATELAEAAVPVAIEAGATFDEGAAHTVLGILANERGDRERARYHHQRSLELAEELGIEPVVQKLNLGCVALDCGDHEEAIALFEDVLASHRRHERPAGIGYALLNLGVAHYELGDHESSRREFEEARACLSEAGLRVQHAYALQGLAAAAASEARFEEAARLLGEARRELDELGVAEIGSDFAPSMVAETKAKAHDALGEEGFAAVYSLDRDVR